MDLHTEKTYEAFAQLAGVPTETIREKVKQSSFFNDYEKGLMPDDQFRDHVRRMLKADLTDQQIDDAWNAMLGIIPLKRLQLLEKLRTNYKVFLLSNTNNIHLTFFNGIIRTVGQKPSLDEFFDQAYYSHLVNMRKPDPEIFEHVVAENKLNAARTLFLDDNADNLRGAEHVGLQTVHITYPDLIFSIFP